MSNSTVKNAGASSCPCGSKNCSRRGNCAECIKYHHGNGTRTSCGK